MVDSKQARPRVKFNPLPHMLYLEHCIISLNNSIFFPKKFLHFNCFENFMENGTFAPVEQMFHSS